MFRMEFYSIEAYVAHLERSIDLVMQDQVADGIKDEIADSVSKNVYTYEPRFYSRRVFSGGIRDKSNMQQDYDPSEKALTITEEAPWQQLYGGDTPSTDLATVIENNEIYNAPPRPFMEKAAKEYLQSGRFNKDLTGTLREYYGL